MVRFPEIYRLTKKWLVLPLLFIMAWQQSITFSIHEKEFLNPIKFIKENYGNDYISQYGNRYEEIKKIFTKPTRMTYIGEANEDYNTGVMHYYLTQYYLTPHNILSKEDYNTDITHYYRTQNSLTSGNIQKKDIIRDTILYNLYLSIHINPESNFYLKNGWHLVKDFNNGLIVLAK